MGGEGFVIDDTSYLIDGDLIKIITKKISRLNRRVEVLSRLYIFIIFKSIAFFGPNIINLICLN